MILTTASTATRPKAARDAGVSLREKLGRQKEVLMFLPLAASIISILLLSSPVAAIECKSELIGLTAFFYSKGNQWSMTWKDDGVHKAKAIYYDNSRGRTNIYSSISDKRSAFLPQSLVGPNEQFNVPFDISRDGGFLISAIHKKDYMDHPSKKFAIVDLNRQSIVQLIETNNNIESLAWAPDRKYFAVLYSRDVTDQVFKGPIDWLAEQIGHGNYYWTFYLTIYRTDGTSVCTSQIEKKLPNAESFIDWNSSR